MSLTDRLAAAQRAVRQHRDSTSSPRRRRAGSATRRRQRRHQRATPGTRAARPREARQLPTRRDPFADLKRIVHPRLVEALGPKLYDAQMTQSELEQQVRLTLQTVLRRRRQPDDDGRPRPHHPGDRRRHPRLRPDRAVPARPRPHRGHGQRPTTSTSSAAASWSRRRRPFTDEAHLRRTIDKIVGQIGRRVDESSPMVDARLPDGSRVNADHPAARPRRLHADHPQVLRRPLHGRRPRSPSAR